MEMSSMQKFTALTELKKSLQNLRSAWHAAEVAIDNIFIDANDYILGEAGTDTQYPFQLSFDEMPVTCWVDGCIEKIDAELTAMFE